MYRVSSQNLVQIALKPYSLSSHPKSKFLQNLSTTKLDLILCKFLGTVFVRRQVKRYRRRCSVAQREVSQTPTVAKLILKENKKRKKKKDNAGKASRNVASCYGFGDPLHTSDVVAPGYGDPETYELKKKHHQRRTVLCRRG